MYAQLAMAQIMNTHLNVIVSYSIRCLFTMLVLCQWNVGLYGQDEDNQWDKVENWKQYLTNNASNYSILVDDEKEPLKFRETPSMVWVNPVRDSQYGVIHVWTNKGRPYVFGSVFVTKDYRTKSRRITHEMHSLATTGLTAKLPSKGAVWHPEVGGVTFKEVEFAGQPAKTRSARMIQMRQISREFTGDSIDLEGARIELRMLTEPIYRYETEEDIHDGAIFTMASTSGTDPEILVILEVRDTPKGPRWHFAAARFSDLSQSLYLKGDLVWELKFPPAVQQWSWKSSESDYYRVFVDADIPEADVESTIKAVVK